MTSLKVNHKNSRDYDLYEDVDQIKSALKNAAYDVKGKAGEVFSESVESLKEQSSLAKDSVANYTAAKPFKSLGIALAAGIIIGYFIHK